MALKLLGRSKFDEQVSEVKSMVLEPGGFRSKAQPKCLSAKYVKFWPRLLY
jgi:hypothetical protein